MKFIRAICLLFFGVIPMILGYIYGYMEAAFVPGKLHAFEHLSDD